MKKVLFCCFILLLLTAAASAQRRNVDLRLRSSVITATERLQLQRDIIRYRMVQRNMQWDGIVTPLEQRRLYKIKRKTRRPCSAEASRR